VVRGRQANGIGSRSVCANQRRVGGRHAAPLYRRGCSRACSGRGGHRDWGEGLDVGAWRGGWAKGLGGGRGGAGGGAVGGCRRHDLDVANAGGSIGRCKS
jgi:hypothetical protein